MLVNGQRGVVHGGAHGALLAELPLLLLAKCMNFFTVHNVFGNEWHFSWQHVCNLCSYAVLMRLFCTKTNKTLSNKPHLYINAPATYFHIPECVRLSINE